MEDKDINMDRIWKEFGKHTTAGKLLYDIYGVGFKPEDHISYPKLQPKKKKITTEDLEKELFNKNAKQSRKPNFQSEKILNKISYPSLQKNTYKPPAKIDLVMKRKNKENIDKDLQSLKLEVHNFPKENKAKNRKIEIEKLQENFQYQDNKNLPEKARPPVVKLSEADLNIMELNIKNTKNTKAYSYREPVNKQEKEYEKLSQAILNEIDERYKFLEETKSYGDTKMQTKIMNEIKDRINDLKTLNKLKDN